MLTKHIFLLRKLIAGLIALLFSASSFAITLAAPPTSPVVVNPPAIATPAITGPVPLTTVTTAPTTPPTSPATGVAPTSTPAAAIPTPAPTLTTSATPTTATPPTPTPALVPQSAKVVSPPPTTAPVTVKPLAPPSTAAAPPAQSPTISQPISTPPAPTAANSIATSPVKLNVPAPPDIDAKAYLLIDANSGYVLAQNNADMRLAPASLTKLMTMYVLSGMLQNGRIHLTDMVTVSEHAWRTGGSRMFAQVGAQISVQDLVNGIIVASGNDACVAMAEYVAGSEHSFVDLMNQTAAQLGMVSTHYADATGLPDPNNYTTAYDLATLSRAIINHYPEDYKWYSQKWTMFNNIKQPNRNLLLWRDPSVDGLKTGHTDEAGFCLVASAKRSDMRLIAIIMNAPSMKDRAVDAQQLLNYGFSFFESFKLYQQNVTLTTQRVWYGKNKTIALGLATDFYVTVPKGQYNKLKAALVIDPVLQAPIKKGQQLGTLQVTLDGQVIATQPLVALTDNAKGNIFSRAFDHIAILFKRWLSTT